MISVCTRGQFHLQDQTRTLVPRSSSHVMLPFDAPCWGCWQRPWRPLRARQSSAESVRKRSTGNSSADDRERTVTCTRNDRQPIFKLIGIESFYRPCVLCSRDRRHTPVRYARGQHRFVLRFGIAFSSGGKMEKSSFFAFAGAGETGQANHRPLKKISLPYYSCTRRLVIQEQT